MKVSSRVWVAVAVTLALALVIGANWRFIDVAFRTHPGCVPEGQAGAAAKPGC